MTVSNKQLGLFLFLLVALTLTLAWIIERQQIKSITAAVNAFGSEIDAYNAAAAPYVPPVEPSPHAPSPAPPSGEVVPDEEVPGE